MRFAVSTRALSGWEEKCFWTGNCVVEVADIGASSGWTSIADTFLWDAITFVGLSAPVHLMRLFLVGAASLMR